MKFTKMQGCGNDYIYVNCFEEQISDPAPLAVVLSDRHYGIGGDGLILIEPSECADVYMHMFNLDGSEGRMCGNGLRCVVKYVYDNGIIPEDRRDAVIETGSGLRHVSFEAENGKVTSVTVDMGTAAAADNPREEIEIDGRTLRYAGMNTGNPHAVVFIKENEALREWAGEAQDADEKSILRKLPLEKIGPEFERSGRFPEGVNVEFISVERRSEISMRVWERGSGETLACGTGATASAAAGAMSGMLDEEVLVHLSGGDLIIKYDSDTGRCTMRGSAVTVFTGEISIE